LRLILCDEPPSGQEKSSRRAPFSPLLKQTRRSKTAELEVMIEKVCGEAGLWPPPAPDAPSATPAEG
jgi:hypothetical protein